MMHDRMNFFSNLSIDASSPTSVNSFVIKALLQFITLDSNSLMLLLSEIKHDDILWFSVELEIRKHDSNSKPKT